MRYTKWRMEAPDINALVQAAQQGNQPAFGKLYDEFAGKLYKFIRFRVGATEVAEDILQDVFLKTWQALPKLELERLHFSAWLYKVARNAVNDHYRRQYRQPQILTLDERFDAPDRTAVAKLVQRSEIEQMRRVSQRLPARWRQVLELRFAQEFSVAEVADIMGKSSVAVRLMQHRALKRLRQLIQDDYDVQYQEVQS